MRIKRFVAIESVCYKLGIELKAQGTRFVGMCPFHHEQHPSFTVFPETNSWFCFSCHVGGSSLQLVSLLVDGVDTWELLEQWLQSTERISVVFKPSPSLETVRKLLSSGNTIKLPEASESSDSFLRSLGVRYARDGGLAGRHIIPIKVDGRLVAFEARDFTSSSIPKTLVFPKGSRVSAWLWNIDSIVPGSSVIVVEGTKGAIAVMHYGYPSVVSSFGARLAIDQVSLLMSKMPAEVIIAFDADEAGAEGTEQAVTNLTAWTDVSVVQLPRGADPWDVSSSVWTSCFNHRRAATKRTAVALDRFRKILL